MLKCTNVFKKLLDLHLKKSLYSTYSSFLVINACNQGKTLCSRCSITMFVVNDVQGAAERTPRFGTVVASGGDRVQW